MPMHGLKQWTLWGAIFTLFTLTQCLSTDAHGQIVPPEDFCRVKPHQSWSEVERWVWSRVCIGEIADLGKRDSRGLDPASAKDWDNERQLSLRFLESVLLNQPWASAVPRQGVRIIGAFFNVNIDLANGRIEKQLWLEKSRFAGTISLANVETQSHVSLEGSYFIGDGAGIDGVKLDGAKIGGRLNMSGAKVSGALDMELATIGGDFFMRDGAEFADMNLNGAKIGGQTRTAIRLGASVLRRSRTAGEANRYPIPWALVGLL